MSDSPPETEPVAPGAERPIQEMRLRSNRAPVMRLSRKVLISLGLVCAAGISSTLFLALRPQPHAARSELYNTNTQDLILEPYRS